MTPPLAQAKLETAAPARFGDVVRGLLPWVVSISVLLVVFGNQDLEALLSAVGRGRWDLFLVVLGGFLGVGLVLDTLFFFLSYRWLAKVGRFGEMLRARAASEILMLLSAVVGLGGLAVYARKRYGVPYRLATGLVLVDLLHEVAAIGALGLAVALLLSPETLPASAAGELATVQRLAAGALLFYGACVFLSLVTKHVRLLQFESVLSVFREISAPQFGAFLGMKILKNLSMGLFVSAGLICFGIPVPPLVAVGFTQVVLLVRGLPVTAFGIGADQMSIPALFGSWDPTAEPGQVLAFSVVYTFSLLGGRALLGLPFVASVVAELRDTSAAGETVP